MALGNDTPDIGDVAPFISGGAGDSSHPVAQSVVNELRAAGLSENGIRGILANVNDESRFNPALRHPDQPKWGGEAHFAHGLYQEGGQEWNNYAAWLKQNYPQASWTDPALQTRFLAENLKANYPKVWDTLHNGTAEQGAQAFVSGYLKPAAQFEAARSSKYASGVPDITSYGGKPSNEAPLSQGDQFTAAMATKQPAAVPQANIAIAGLPQSNAIGPQPTRGVFGSIASGLGMPSEITNALGGSNSNTASAGGTDDASKAANKALQDAIKTTQQAAAATQMVPLKPADMSRVAAVMQQLQGPMGSNAGNGLGTAQQQALGSYFGAIG
jgi:hypothetical protein